MNVNPQKLTKHFSSNPVFNFDFTTVNILPGTYTTADILPTQGMVEKMSIIKYKFQYLKGNA